MSTDVQVTGSGGISPPLGPIPRPSLVEQVMGQLRAAIHRGVYRPGTRLMQDELAAELGVSRTPLRLALGQLRQEGMVEETTQGFRVTLPDQREQQDILYVYAAIEGACARLAAEQIDRAGLARLRAALERPESAGFGGGLRAAADPGDGPANFHDLIAAALGNLTVARLRAVALAPSQLFMLNRMRAARILTGRGHQEHQAILAALEARDGDAAERAAREHVLGAQPLLAAELAQDLQREGGMG